MRSIISITWGRPKMEAGLVTIPFGMYVTDDVEDRENKGEIGPVVWQPSSLTFMPKTVAMGQAKIEETIASIMEDQRNNYGPLSVGKLRKESLEYVRANDLSPLVHPAWAKSEPYRRTTH